MSQAVVKTVRDFSTGNDDVRNFNSDNVLYMNKAFVETLFTLFPVHSHHLPQQHCQSYSV